MKGRSVLALLLLLVATIQAAANVEWQPETQSINLASENQTFSASNAGFLITGYASIDTVELYTTSVSCTTCTGSAFLLTFNVSNPLSFEILIAVPLNFNNGNISGTHTLSFNYSGLSPETVYLVFFGFDNTYTDRFEIVAGTSTLKSGVSLDSWDFQPSVTPAFKIPRQALTEQEYQFSFVSWMQGQNKSYTSAEFLVRYAIYKDNLDYINLHNSGNSSYTLGTNENTDLSFEEFSSLKLMHVPRMNVTVAPNGNLICKLGDVVFTLIGNILDDLFNGLFPRTEKRAPTRVDWRESGIVTPAKNQESCGSCYAFGTIATVESAIAKKTGRQVDLSEQQVVDCSYYYTESMNGGCGGGHEVVVMDYIKQNGLVEESTYPYRSGRTQTHYSCQRRTGTHGKNLQYKMVPSGNEQRLAEAVAAYGPHVISISGENRDFQMFRGGIYDNPRCPKTVDHVIQVVGYGTEGGKDYWIVKNSWGTTWGQNGFGKVLRGVNQCGIVSDKSWSITV